MQLRADELATAQRAFNARGSKVVRCEGCLLPTVNCMCASKPTPAGQCAVAFIMYKGEYYKPTNTGRLIADVIADNHAFLWHRTMPCEPLLALLNNPLYQPIIVFPHEYASEERCIHQPVAAPNKKLLFIFLDGTWREARKMFGKSPYLDSLPVLGVSPDIASNYLLRASTHEFQHCTAEVGTSVLDLAGETESARNLAQYFSVFRHQYLKGKPHLTHKIEFAKAQVDQ